MWFDYIEPIIPFVCILCEIWISFRYLFSFGCIKSCHFCRMSVTVYFQFFKTIQITINNFYDTNILRIIWAQWCNMLSRICIIEVQKHRATQLQSVWKRQSHMSVLSGGLCRLFKSMINNQIVLSRTICHITGNYPHFAQLTHNSFKYTCVQCTHSSTDQMQ